MKIGKTTDREVKMAAMRCTVQISLLCGMWLAASLQQMHLQALRQHSSQGHRLPELLSASDCGQQGTRAGPLQPGQDASKGNLCSGSLPAP